MSKILVVEDDHDLRFLYEMAFSRRGHEVVAVEHTADALVALTNDLFDLMVLDMNMPDVPGIRIVEFVKDDVRLKAIPVMVVSATDQWQEKLIGLPVKRFLLKPVTMEELIEEADKLLEA
jgi:DNA-binding response OmpR family regulator